MSITNSKNFSKVNNNLKKNLLNIDFKNCEEKLNSPRSKKALLLLGIEEKDLFYISKNDFFHNHPELTKLNEDFKLKKYENYENIRKSKIKKAIELREQLLKKTLSTFSQSSDKNYFSNTSKNFKKTQSLLDLSVSYKEKEKFDLMKKQNLLEVKNLIDSFIKSKEKEDETQNRLKEKFEKEEKLNQLKRELKNKQEKEERKREKEFYEKEKIEKKNQEKEYNEYFKKQMEEYKKEKKKKNQLQKEYHIKQLNWQRQEKEFKNKMKNLYKNKQEIAERKLRSLDIKNEQRIKRILESRKKMNDKFRLESFKREIKVKNAFKKFEKERKEKKEKFDERQKMIQQFQDEQKIKKEHEIQEQLFKREEKEKRNANLKKRNEEILEKKRQQLLNQFEKNEQTLQNFKDYNEKKHQQKIYENLIKEDNMNNILKENQNKIKYHNILKLKEYEDKNRKVKELKIRQRNVANQKIKLMDEMRDKKIKMLKNVQRLINKSNNINRYTIYHKIFSPEDLSFLSGKTNSFFTPLYNSISQTNFFKHKKLENLSNKNSFLDKTNIKSDRVLMKKTFNDND